MLSKWHKCKGPWLELVESSFVTSQSWRFYAGKIQPQRSKIIFGGVRYRLGVRFTRVCITSKVDVAPTPNAQSPHEKKKGERIGRLLVIHHQTILFDIPFIYVKRGTRRLKGNHRVILKQRNEATETTIRLTDIDERDELIVILILTKTFAINIVSHQHK